ncbi:Peptidase family M3 [Gemmata sp. SH-PL17]|uniref:M2 family metallopeptidase n=1 Tax=Gemmata sp. SH-PL17 TaxID=1630693 RepID=UPI00078CEC8F|nr:M2 family metallopeptidase [Gemmata sp. SH-PL17]AMV29665.1 Peptidase family M3 [Gemmata sp. SH-PL17]
MQDRRTFLLTGGATVAATLIPDALSGADGNDEAAAVIKAHVTKLQPLEVASGIAWWTANTTGKDEDFQKKEEAQNKIDAALSDKKMFDRVKALKAAADKGGIKDALTARQIQLLYLQYLEKQVAPELLKKITAKANAVEQAFNVFRAKVDGQEIPDSKVRSTLKESTDSTLRQKVWEASKGVGAAVEADLAELVKLRNEAATQLGFKNFHALQLTLNEQDGTELIKLFDDLDKLTKEPFTKSKAEIDERLAKKLNVAVTDLQPWSYFDPFFQESPAVFDANLDAPYTKADLLKLCRDFYAGIGLPIDDVIARSDLYEKKGKSPHAFCTDIDREGDVRVLANIVPNEYWMGTMLHELGHSVYSSKNIPQTVPYLLRAEAHILATEGVAMQFERFSKSRAWLEKMGVKVDAPAEFDEAAKKVQRNQLLIFSRWCQVMLRFEKAMYEDPKQNLNKLWWDLVEQYQQVKKPKDRNAPDYASKIHICSAPVYYHNYMMGQLFASQVHHALSKAVFNADPKTTIYIGEKKVGGFMKEKVFEPGRTKTWKELAKFATGEELSPAAFAKDFEG